jgi:FdhD protein
VPLIPDKAVEERRVWRCRDGHLEAEVVDHLAVEEPLEIRVAGEPLAVTMRTPGDDHRLALGFLFAEGILRSAQDVGTVTHCGRPGEEGYGNVIDVIPAAGADLPIEEKVTASRRGTLTTSACGVCGRRTVEDLFELCGPLPEGPPLPLGIVATAPERLAEAQRIFARTGGVHAAAALAADGEPLAVFEDVGRHNAVDKVVGALLLRGLGTPELPTPALLVVSGRSSFEIVQKAAMARIPVVASVSAGSSLAASLAETLGMALVTFVRPGGRLQITCGRHRLAPD